MPTQKQKIRVIACIPGAANLKPILRTFLASGPGWVTSLSDLRLRSLSALLGSQSDAVRPFAEIVGEFLTRLHVQKLPLAQAGHTRAAVGEACLSLPDESIFAGAARFPGTHRKIASALSELRDWGLDGDALANAAEQATGTLALKLKSLAFVEREVADSLRSIARERGSDRIAASLDVAGEGTDLGRLFVVAGSELAYNHVQWLHWASLAGSDITVVVDGARQDLFRDLTAATGRLGCERIQAGLPNQLQSRIFDQTGIGGEPVSEADLSVRVESSSDPLAESEWALRSIFHDLQSGLQPQEIAIFCRDPEGYMPLLDAAANRFEIPISCSRRLPLLGNSFARFVLEILEFCAGEDVRALAPVLRSSYLKLDETSREAAELQLKKAFAEKQDQWKALEEWTKEAPDSTIWLAPLLEWRRKYLHQPTPLFAWCERLRELGQQPWQDEALTGAAQTSARDGYAESAMQRSLAQYASIDRTRGIRQLTLGQFVSACRRIWDEADVSALSDPTAIQVVSSTLLLGDVRAVYVLGLLEGVFPRRRSEDPILTDSERAELSSMFADRLPLSDSHAKALRERDEFYRLCGAASEKLVLSYPQTDDDRDNVRAFYLAEVERAIPERVEADHPRQDLAPEESSAPVDQALRLAYSCEHPEKPLPNILETEEAKAKVSEAGSRHLTPRSLGDVLECPFRYVAESAMDIRPNRMRSRWHHLYRLPAKTGLATLPFRETAEHAMKLALEAELNGLIADATQDDLAMMRAGGERLIEEWLDREFSSRDIWPRESIIDGPSFEHGHLRSKMRLEDGDIMLKGDFPALSEREGYKILHLFRASEPWNESALREDDPWQRLNEKDQFELGLYLAALYTPNESRVGIEIDSASGTRNLFLMPRPEEPFRSDQAHAFKVTVIDEDRRADMFRAVGERMRTAMRRIRQAMVDATPGEHCLNCDYGELCRRSYDFGEEVDPFGKDEFDPS